MQFKISEFAQVMGSPDNRRVNQMAQGWGQRVLKPQEQRAANTLQKIHGTRANGNPNYFGLEPESPNPL